MIVEYWTESRNALVLVGEKSDIEWIAANLGVTVDQVTEVGPCTRALGLWGASLRAYLHSDSAAQATALRAAACPAAIPAMPLQNGRMPGVLSVD